MILWNNAPQGSEEWIAARTGRITGSRYRDARDFSAKGLSTAKRDAYAMDIAREREGGVVPSIYVNAAMKTGTEQEPIARMRYEAQTGELVEEVGFAYTEDGKFGLSPDGLIGDDGVFETKTMVSSQTIFKAMVDDDISEYRSQCVGYLWLLGRKWVDLALWCPDLDVLHITRIERDEDEIQKMEDDLMAFDKHVDGLRAKLRRAINRDAPPSSCIDVRKEQGLV